MEIINNVYVVKVKDNKLFSYLEIEKGESFDSFHHTKMDAEKRLYDIFNDVIWFDPLKHDLKSKEKGFIVQDKIDPKRTFEAYYEKVDIVINNR